MGLVFDGSLYRGFSSEAGEYQSILFANSNPPTWQVSLSAEEMDRAATDVAVQQKMVRELLGNMMLLLQVLNPRALYIGGDLAMHKDLIFQELEHYYTRQWQSLRAKGCSLEVVEDGRFDPAWGAAAAMLEELYSIPQIGEKSRGNSLVSLATQ